jgi:hypothetical protein
MIIELKGDFTISLQNALMQWCIKGIFIIIPPQLFFSPLPPPPSAMGTTALCEFWPAQQFSSILLYS